MKSTCRTKDLLSHLALWTTILIATGAVIETLHWAFFGSKPVIEWAAFVAATAGVIKWLHWKLYLRPEEPSQDEKDYAAWFDA